MTEILSTPETPQHSSLDPNTFVIPCRLLGAYQLTSPKNTRELSQMLGQKILAVAGIAAPEKFFKPLRDLGLQVETLALEDHADYSAMDFKNYPTDQVDVILMTEKDAVKCRHLDDERIWVVPLEAILPNEMLDIICEVLHR
jgi:tetraacyldisaccharide 4'-kinase